MKPDITDKAAIKEAAALLYAALHLDAPNVVKAVEEQNPIHFGMTLKAIAESDDSDRIPTGG